MFNTGTYNSQVYNGDDGYIPPIFQTQSEQPIIPEVNFYDQPFTPEVQ